MKFKAFVILVVLLCFGQSSPFAADQAPSGILEELRDAHNFLVTLYALAKSDEVERFIGERVKVGDPLSKHRALLSLAADTKLNPYSNRFVFRFQKNGENRQDGQGFWVLHIETDAENKVAVIWAGVAKR